MVLSLRANEDRVTRTGFSRLKGAGLGALGASKKNVGWACKAGGICCLKQN